MENTPTEIKIKDNNLNWKLFGRVFRSVVGFFVTSHYSIHMYIDVFYESFYTKWTL